jgi:hypothetical protein
LIVDFGLPISIGTMDINLVVAAVKAPGFFGGSDKISVNSLGLGLKRKVT